MGLFRKLGRIPEESPSFRVETSCSIKRLLEDEELCCWLHVVEFLSVCACVRLCVCACVRACVCVCVCVCVREREMGEGGGAEKEEARTGFTAFLPPSLYWNLEGQTLEDEQ